MNSKLSKNVEKAQEGGFSSKDNTSQKNIKRLLCYHHISCKKYKCSKYVSHIGWISKAFRFVFCNKVF